MFKSFRDLYALVDQRERWALVILVCVMLISGLTEMAGAASILPLLGVLTAMEGQGGAMPWAKAFGLTDARSVLIFLAGASFLLVVGGQALKGLTSYLIVQFGKRHERLISTRLFKRISERRYEWFLRQNSTLLTKLVIGDAADLVQGALVPSLYVLAHGAVFACVVALLLVINPAAALGMGAVVAVAYGLILMVAQHHLKRLGKERDVLVGARQKIATEYFTGIKEVKLRGVEQYFLDAFDAPSSRLARLQSVVTLMGELPRYVLEATVFGAMLVFLLVMLSFSSGSIVTVLPTLGLFAFAGVRLFPTLQLLYANLTAMYFNRHTVSIVSAHLNATPEVAQTSAAKRAQAIPLRKSVRLDHVSFAYPEAGRASLRDVSLTIPAHSTVGIVGRTGAGKTTLVDIVLGLLAPQSGSISIDGQKLRDAQRQRWQQSIGYVPQQIFLADDTVRANIAFGVAPAEIDDEALRRAARLANIDEFITTELPEGYDTPIGERGVRLSGGQRQRIGIARALYHEPSLIVFDEATSGLDNTTERAVMDAIANIGRSVTVLVVTHRWSSVRYCDRIFVIDGGRCVGTGTFGDLSDHNAKFQELMLG